ncbi:MAG: hypothetical protein D6768_06255 [Chloroflexi bacterium]|nr:MAG: hypothetical protein D6768_06255 [Chloroflexota bacterium]
MEFTDVLYSSIYFEQFNPNWIVLAAAKLSNWFQRKNALEIIFGLTILWGTKFWVETGQRRRR